jgi:para-nitrobenzyl esterase
MNRRDFLAWGRDTVAAAVVANPSLASLRVQNAGSGSGAPIVETAFGRIRGARLDGVAAFKGVSYGAPTGGNRRFLPPVAPEPWTGTRDATELGPRSPQPVRIMVPEMGDTLTGSGPMSEDCLRLNVWTPGVGPGARRPVMVYLHGGGFRTGSGGARMYDGKELARRHDVVVVTVNHRLNVFGFLYLAENAGDKYRSSSNVGMLDIVQALEWVRDNIDRFGGDPRNVTVFGQSGGGGKTSMLLAFPAAKGLFHRAIVQSTLSDTAVRGLARQDAVKATATLLARLGVGPADIDAVQKIPVERLLSALVGGSGPAGETARDARPAAGADAPLAGDLSLRFTPVVDGRTLPSHPFDPAAPAVSADVPLMCGSVETESVPYQAVSDPYWSTSVIDDAGLTDRVKRSLSIPDRQAAEVIALYRHGRPTATNADLAVIIASDNSTLRTSEYEIGERKAAVGKAPVYMYYFQWYSPVHDGRVRAMHCIELPFVFDHVDDLSFMVGAGRDRQPLADKVSAAWVAFARSGNPSHPGLPRWSPFTAAARTTMVFDRECGVIDDPHRDERLALQAIRTAQDAGRP